MKAKDKTYIWDVKRKNGFETVWVFEIFGAWGIYNFSPSLSLPISKSNSGDVYMIYIIWVYCGYRMLVTLAVMKQLLKAVAKKAQKKI